MKTWATQNLLRPVGSFLFRNEWIPIPAWLLPWVLGAALGRRPQRWRPPDPDGG